MPAPKLRLKLRLPYAKWERAMLAGRLPELRAYLATVAELLQPAYDEEWDRLSLEWENTMLYGSSHHEEGLYGTSPAMLDLPGVRMDNALRSLELRGKVSWRAF